MKRLIPFALLAAVAILVPLSPSYYAGLATYAVVLALFGLSVNLTVGYLGYISFGHAMFFGLGAYTAGLLTVKLGVNFWLAAALATLPGAALGALVGFASLRVGGAYFAIATLTTAEIFRLIALNWIELTRGPLGIVVPRPRIGWLDVTGVTFQHYYLLIAMAVLGMALLAIRRLIASPYGRAWQTIREAPNLAESVGISTLRLRVLNVALSGGLAALAGALLVPKILVLSPDLFAVTLSATGLLAVILGGRATLAGPVIGGIIFAVLPESLRVIDDYRLAVFALLLLIAIRVQPDGIMALIHRFRPVSEVVPAVATVPPAASHAMGDGALGIEGVSKRFGGLQAVADVSFAVRSHELVGLIGPNGAGKTTCLSLISGFQPPSDGRVTFAGKAITGLAPHAVAALGLIRTFQQTTVCATRSAYQNVLAGTHLQSSESLLTSLLRTRGYREREAARAAQALRCLALVGLTGRAATPAGALAYGEQRMLSIAVALAARPRTLLLDEPAAGLNHTEAARLADLLRRLRDDGLTVVIIDHNLRMMMALCDRIVVLHHGRKLAEGAPAAVTADPDVVRAYLGDRAAATEVHHAVT
ncbi:branched-chain amino acid ABC transporter ATP-binding protein/permease [Azospirillum endophyticum]